MTASRASFRSSTSAPSVAMASSSSTAAAASSSSAASPSSVFWWEVDGGRGRAEVWTQQNAREDFAHERGHLEEPGGDRAADADGGKEHDEGAEVVSWRGQQASE